MSNSKGIALVTGAARGLGYSIALRLAQDGFDLGLNDLAPNREALESLKKEIGLLGRSASTHIADVSQEDQVVAMIAQVIEQHGGLDVMVANAGVAGAPGVPFIEIPVEEWDRVMNINTRSTFLCYKHAAAQMVKQGRGGSIIGASSVAGKQGMPFNGPYSASKFAIRGLTQAVASEYGSHGIRVNAYAPGLIDTPMLNAAAVNGDVAQLKAQILQQQPIQRTGAPNDVASVVSFLASKESTFITGQSISVNGGLFYD
ncbi:NAD-binding protein [Mycena indigotica]|uniref:NAD-binding protein n=1 Tax=Mycena indigotica TaxID=2126181 RepID=A0A8H6SR47_9AGAR|nr:NAD-binding protein [Mycena indigotica]KAF7303874.1 NAD-binding protein [Mycena indigotica]